MKITRENLKNIVREAMVEESAYQEFFKKALEKTGKSIPQMSDDEKKAFFNKIDSAWKGKGEKNEGNAFGAAVADAKKDGDDSFKVGGKEYKVESNEEDLDEEAVVVSKRTPSGNIVSKLKEELESVNEGTDIYLNKRIQITKFAGQNGQMVQINAPKYQTAGDHIAMSKDEFIRMLKNSSKILNQLKESNESTNERMGSDKGAVGNANFKNRLKAMRDAKNSVVVYIDTNKGKKLLKVFKTQQTAQQFKKKNMDKLLNTKGVESVGTMPKKEWDAKEAKYAIESVNEGKFDKRSLLKMILKHDDAMITTNRGKEYIIYNPNSNNKENADMWKGNNSVFAVDKNGDEHEIKYSDITNFKA